MTAAAVANDIDYDVFIELLTELEGQLSNTIDGLRVVTVHVEDWRLNALCDIGRVYGRARLRWRCGEANLVVNHDVDGSAGLVAAKLRHVQNFGNNTLAGKGRITVNQDRQHRIGGVVDAANAVELCAHDSLENRVYGFEVRRVSRKRNLDLLAFEARVNTFGAEVILNIARTLNGVGVVVAFELTEHLTIGFAGDVSEHIESTAVGHSNCNFF